MQKLMKWCRIWLIGALFFFNNCQCEKIKSPYFKKANQDSLTVLFTTNVQGYVESCGCTSNPLGGIARLAFLIDEAKKVYPHQLIFVDAGNLLFDSSQPRNEADRCQDEARIDLLLSTYQNLNLVGTVQGPFDSARGQKFYQAILQRHNIVLLNQQPLMGKIIEQSGKKIGFLGASVANEVQIKKQLTVLKSKKVDIVIVISQLPVPMLRSIFENNSEVDVIISGRDTGEKPMPPEQIGEKGPLLVSAAMQGQYLGVLEFQNISQKKLTRFQLDDQKEQFQRRYRLLSNRADALKKQLSETTTGNKDFLKNHLEDIKDQLENLRKEEKDQKPLAGPFVSVRTIALEQEIKQNKKVQEQLLAYGKSIPELGARCEAGISCPPVKAGEATYVGVLTCKNCHQAAVNFWENAIVDIKAKNEKGEWIKKKSGHSIAWSTLEEVRKERDRSCIGCHSIGFMKPGGYCKTSEVDFRKNVQCESCHGPGSLHSVKGDKRFIKRQVPESTCRSCHHVPHIETTESFVYEEKLKLILGKGHGFDLLSI